MENIPRGRRSHETQKPSTTARKVALNILALGSKPGMEGVLPAGIVDATARLLVAAGVVGPGTVRFARSRWAVAIYEAFDWMMPGQFEAFAHRKAFCEGQVREGIAAGATQVLFLGAGYDTLGWRLAPEFPEVRFFEIDHPATGGRKARGIDGMGARDNLQLIEEDLGSRRLEEVLDDVESWDSTAMSVIVAEGLTQYLEPAAVRDLFVQWRRPSGWAAGSPSPTWDAVTMDGPMWAAGPGSCCGCSGRAASHGCGASGRRSCRGSSRKRGGPPLRSSGTRRADAASSTTRWRRSGPLLAGSEVAAERDAQLPHRGTQRVWVDSEELARPSGTVDLASGELRREIGETPCAVGSSS